MDLKGNNLTGTKVVYAPVSSSGLVMSNNEEADANRVLVKHVGPEVDRCKVGDLIIVTRIPLRGVPSKGKMLYFFKNDEVLAVDNDSLDVDSV